MMPNYYVMPLLSRRVNLSESTREMRKVEIFHQVIKRYGVTITALKSSNREAELVFARHLIMYLMRKKTTFTLKEIGQMFGRDHTTVINACRSIDNYIYTDDPRSIEIHEFMHTV